MKQIEEGCLAIVVNSEAGNNGKCVTVGQYLGKVEGWRDEARWAVDTELKGIAPATGEACPHRHCAEAKLLRIDSYEGETEEERAEEEIEA